MNVARVALIAHTGKPEAVALRKEVAEFLADRGIAVSDDDPDLVISLGGDGTMLRAAQTAHEADAPLLGVNLGLLGYLNEVDAGDERAALERIFAGDFHTEERMMLSCEVQGNDYIGLNEVLVERSSRHRLVRLRVRVGHENLATFNGDGVIVATPTGSTAYALSAGGPIVSPAAECLVLVPVNAHMIFTRPFVLTPTETVEIEVDPSGGAAALSLDGTIGSELSPGAVVTVRRHPRPLRLVRVAGPGFIERLRRKLDLPG